MISNIMLVILLALSSTVVFSFSQPLQHIPSHGPTSIYSSIQSSTQPGTGQHLDTSGPQFFLQQITGQRFDISDQPSSPGLPTSSKLLVPTLHPSLDSKLAPAVNYKGAVIFYLLCPSGSATDLAPTFGHKGEMALWLPKGVLATQDTWPSVEFQPLDTISHDAMRLLASVLLATCQALDLIEDVLGNNMLMYLLQYMVCSGKFHSQSAFALKVTCGWEF